MWEPVFAVCSKVRRALGAEDERGGSKGRLLKLRQLSRDQETLV